MKNIMQKEILAKSYNLRTNQQEQTLVEHIKDLFEVLESILELNLYSDKDVEILKICCALHDLGKINSIMQQKMEINNKISYSCSEEERKKLESDKKSLKKIARHNIFSGAFLKDILEKMNLSEEDKLYIYKSIMLHHGNYEDYMRLSISKVQEEIYEYIEKGILEKEEFNLKDIESYINNILNVDFKFGEDVLDYDYIDKLSESMFIDSDYNNGQIDDSVLNYRKFKYILYKGMLNLIDHSASSRQKGIKFYNDFTDEEIDDMILNEIHKSQGNLEKNNIEFNTIQKRLREFSGRNVLTVAFTGSGKTAADYRKTFKRKFFLVPNKISAESFYRKNIFQNKNDLDTRSSNDYIGLLHGDINLYSENEDNGEHDFVLTLRDIDLSINFCKPCVIATVDQLLLSMFKFPGYEKIFAAVKNASITVDEVHLLEPKMFLILIYFMQFACKYLDVDFHLMTATLPKSYKEQMINKGIIFQEESNENVTDKGEIVFIESNKEEEICEGKDVKVSFIKEKEIKSIVEGALENKQKILIIKNTIDSVNRTYEFLKENLSYKYGGVDIDVLHSRFKFKDKKEKYSKILNGEGDIWISTQSVEISLDLDFNIIISDLATMDSLIQRMGRCNRNNKYEYGNFYILPSEDKIYDKKLKNTTKNILKDILKTNSIFTMGIRKTILDDYYDNSVVKNYFEENFISCDKEIKNIYGINKETFDGLDLIFNFEPYKNIVDSKEEAAEIFRDVDVSYKIILEEDFYKENRDLQQNSIQVSEFIFSKLYYYSLISKVEGYMVLKSSSKFEYNSTVGLILK
ncbi:CRISPR-associated helicase/endonuclease Cas3 [Clostridioides difficile]|uniref:CRISPR-associated helicase/endonuclease Cas3 n=1 Tax=Clostridioides difficile TaxID=1496 RepID=UPI00097FDF1E|nr:CRISPR-associated helicase/endonuclease Cas3 [Clostridioides difficile]SJP13317.1 helicase Cas3 [Clostridioides difficile]HBF4253581.1 CRISPR-associated helicase/endonuclease Cas3 [Clostridioides difficile]HDO9120560.1 CRISPR-associated helicase/endonuclease Cas3 [Clostridioides difficile]HDO9648517.1 CRISPR-associated helicase/endonuclease Cas3 [Clostridioides difficile]